MPGVVADRRLLEPSEALQDVRPGPTGEPAGGPSREVAGAGPHGDGGVHGRAAAEHLAPAGMDGMADGPGFGHVAPVVAGVAADPVGKGQRVGVARERVGRAGFQQNDAAGRILAESTREHRASAAAPHDDDVVLHGGTPRRIPLVSLQPQG